MKRVLYLLRAGISGVVLLCFVSQISNCQTVVDSTSSPTPTPTRGPYSPAPYRDDEFPQELKDVRRAEVITLGAVPLSYLLSSQLYNLGRFLWLVGTNHADQKFYFSGSGSTYNTGEFDKNETLGLLASSLIIGLGIAVADNVIMVDERIRQVAEEERIRLLREERERQIQTLNEISASPSPSGPEATPQPSLEPMPSPTATGEADVLQ